MGSGRVMNESKGWTCTESTSRLQGPAACTAEKQILIIEMKCRGSLLAFSQAQSFVETFPPVLKPASPDWHAFGGGTWPALLCKSTSPVNAFLPELSDKAS